jgi:hypothetical protein
MSFSDAQAMILTFILTVVLGIGGLSIITCGIGPTAMGLLMKLTWDDDFGHKRILHPIGGGWGAYLITTHIVGGYGVSSQRSKLICVVSENVDKWVVVICS